MSWLFGIMLRSTSGLASPLPVSTVYSNGKGGRRRMKGNFYEENVRFSLISPKQRFSFPPFSSALFFNNRPCCQMLRVLSRIWHRRRALLFLFIPDSLLKGNGAQQMLSWSVKIQPFAWWCFTPSAGNWCWLWNEPQHTGRIFAVGKCMIMQGCSAFIFILVSSRVLWQGAII